jgi:transglutaminase-like putative cysteine protease
VFPARTTELSIEVDLVAEMSAQNPFDFFLEPHAERWPFEYEALLDSELAPYRRTLADTPLLTAFVASISREGRSAMMTSSWLPVLATTTARYGRTAAPAAKIQVCQP